MSKRKQLRKGKKKMTHRGEYTELATGIFEITCDCGFKQTWKGAPYEVKNILFKHYQLYPEQMAYTDLKTEIEHEQEERRKRSRYKRQVKASSEIWRKCLSEQKCLGPGENGYLIYRKVK